LSDIRYPKSIIAAYLSIDSDLSDEIHGMKCFHLYWTGIGFLKKKIALALENSISYFYAAAHFDPGQ
jgi:hypothetical protein